VCAACPTPHLDQSYELSPSWEQRLRYVPHRVRNGYKTSTVTRLRRIQDFNGYKTSTYTRLQRDLDKADHLQSQAFHFLFCHSICLHHFSIFEPPYPARYSTHITTLITTNHFLTAHFTLPSALLYSHHHTDQIGRAPRRERVYTDV
jgi:hypothetical protein